MSDAGDVARSFRIGIDVGGTFTKAVLIDNATRAVAGRYSVLTTHDHRRGVAAGVVEVFRNVLTRSGVSAEEVVFIAHSTTQATNALLEGDVAKVGVLGMASEAAAGLAEAQVHIAPVELAPGRTLTTANRFLITDALSEDAVRQAVAELAGEGADVLVASSAFGVDDTGSEELVRTLGSEAGLLTTCGHDITRLYGLTTRTRTAVINASILPRMNATAEMTEASVREAGIKAPLMIMRGDGGVMDIREMRRRPATTMLSGPAASVAGALMHLRVSDGIYFEVGGTSTNIGVIRNGRPTVAYAHVGGHETYVSSLDVRVAGVAGGSLVRARQGALVDVGPRSAHIAGLAYAAFADSDAMVDAQIECFEPKPGDGADHVAVRGGNGERYALTTTCAANVLGYAKPGSHAHGNQTAARRAFEVLGEFIGTSAEAAARAVLECASDKIVAIVEGLVAAYRLDSDQCLLIGEGGGAAALVPFVAERLELDYEISKDAEVISSIGVALALVRDVVERVIPHPKPEDLQAIRNEALEAAVRLGAHATTVDVTVEIDQQTQRVRATAMGAAEMHVKDPGGAIHEREARKVAATSLGVAPAELHLVAQSDGFRVYQVPGPEAARTRAIDREGTIRVRRRAALVRATPVSQLPATIAGLWSDAVRSADHGQGAPEILLAVERHVVDLSGIETVDQALVLAAMESDGLADDAVVIVVAVPQG